VHKVLAQQREVQELEEMMSEQAKPIELKLSKMQRIRKRELRRAMDLLHEEITFARDTQRSTNICGLRVAITILGEMRKRINSEGAEHV
jgi:hypothetical protein